MWAGTDKLVNGSQQNQLFTVSILYNRSGATQDFYNPGTGLMDSVADENLRVFRYNPDTDTYLEIGATVFGNGGTATRMWFRNDDGAGNTNNLLIDDLRWDNTQLIVNGVVPEPATFALLTGGSLMMMRRRRRIA